MKATRLFAVLFVLCLMGTHAVYAVDHGSIAIHGELGGTGGHASWTDNSGSDDPSTRIGVRLFLTQGVAFDANFGFGFESEVERDVDAQTSSHPSASTIFFQGGFCLEAIKTDRATLNVLGRLGFTVRTWYDAAYQGGDYYKYEYYGVVIPSLTLALEPSYFFTDNMSVFANFGVTLRMIPNSQYIDEDHSDYDWDDDTFPLKDRDDGKTLFGTTGILIGFRYFIN